MTTENKTLYFFELDQKFGKSIRIPPNFAHGFIALEATNFEYLCLGEYSEQHERTINILKSAGNFF